MNELLAKIYNDVAEIAALRNRKDAVLREIVQQTRKIHRMRVFANDVTVASIKFSPLTTKDCISTALLGGYRMFIPGMCAIYDSQGKALSVIQSTAALSGVQTLRGTVFMTEAANHLHFLSKEKMARGSIAYATMPRISVADYNSWIAEQYPDVIVERVIALQLAAIGSHDAGVRMTESVRSLQTFISDATVIVV